MRGDQPRHGEPIARWRYFSTLAAPVAERRPNELATSCFGTLWGTRSAVYWWLDNTKTPTLARVRLNVFKAINLLRRSYVTRTCKRCNFSSKIHPVWYSYLILALNYYVSTKILTSSISSHSLFRQGNMWSFRCFFNQAVKPIPFMQCKSAHFNCGPAAKILLWCPCLRLSSMK